jgi:UbiD family decarboxylase
MTDLREWMEKADALGELKTVKGAHWDLEIGCISDLDYKLKAKSSALLFDEIKGYPKGFRVLTNSTGTLGRVCLTLKLPLTGSIRELIDLIRQKEGEWESKKENFPPEEVTSGPIFENVDSGKAVNLFKFPVPKWHELDGGRYIGTGDAVITMDPDTKEVNLGTYRVMIQDETSVGLYISPGKHGRIHYEKWHEQGKPCPVAISVGHHPIIFRVGAMAFPASGIEYKYTGSILGEPVKIVREEITGLPIPAEAEIVLVGWCIPGEMKNEGPFGEWTGLYASKVTTTPVVRIERVYYRNNPILLGEPPEFPPSAINYFQILMRSAQTHNELLRNGIPDIKGVWHSEEGIYQFIIVSLKQRYPGHAKQAALSVMQSRWGGAYMGRYVVVVDEDIDPSNMHEVMWAICNRSDPEKDIDIIRRCWSSPLDGMIRKPSQIFSNSRAIIDATKPFEWKDDYPKTVKYSPELRDGILKKWKDMF